MLTKKKIPVKNRNTRKTEIKDKQFPIVAIGASAGGLEAYSELLRNVPSDTGMAFVVIQHLDPAHKSYLDDILSRVTDMQVNVIKDGTKPEPDNVYVIPSNAEVSIDKGIFRTAPRQKFHKNRMPIDTFMRSLAEDNMHYAIGVVLSGSDSDGAIGLETIKSEGGITYAQDKKTAKFFDMPYNAVNAGAVDFVLPPLAIARELGRISRNPYLKISRINTPEVLIPDGSTEITKIFQLLNSNNGVDFTGYKPTTIKRRILRRMVIQKLTRIKDYGSYLKKHPIELDALCEDILINVTSFFRDPEMYDALRTKVFPVVFKNRDRTTPVRVWVSACSTGEEAYSMAISLIEYLEENSITVPVHIFSTDLSQQGIEKARSGVYPADIKNDVSADRLRKYFVSFDGGYRIIKPIREMCVFAKHNLIQDPPFSKIDIVSCRNVLIYLGQVLQNKILPIFHYALKPAGFLVLGTSETVGTFSTHFEQIDSKNKIYSKRMGLPKAPFDFTNARPLHHASHYKKTPAKILNKIQADAGFQKVADSIILNKYAPASVVINSNFEIIQFRGHTGSYLEFPRGEPAYNLLKITRGELGLQLRHLLKKAVKTENAVRKNNLEFTSNGNTININLIVAPLVTVLIAEKLYLVIFEESGAKKSVGYEQSAELPALSQSHKLKNRQLSDLRGQLSLSKDNLQSTVEQLESARSANEEIQSSNEQLQSTNEELETAKEELQSTNEELTTVNEELQNRDVELSNLNNDLNNLLSSVNIPIVMLDNDLRIRRFTNVAARLLNLIPPDIGRKITDLNMNVKVPDLEKLISDVIETPATKELTLTDKQGCWHSMRIRPYKTLENKIDGVMIAFIDITEIRESLAKQQAAMQEIADLNKNLEKRIKERTSDLESVNRDLASEVLDRKHAEDSLRTLSKHLVKAQEGERLRLSRDLHDSVNQILTVAKLKIHSVKNSLDKDNDGGLKDISEAKNLLEKAIDEVRKISMNLRPSALDDLGLKAAIHSLIDELEHRTKIKVDFITKNLSGRLSGETELALYRMIQEALNNVEKHSKATAVNIEIGMRDSELNLKVRDNGKGFKLLGKNSGKINLKKYGILGMRERSEAVGGKFEIITSPGSGTEINIAIPFIKNE